MEEYAQYLFVSFERWNDEERSSSDDHRQKLRLLDDLYDVVSEFMDKRLRKYRKIDQMNRILFGEEVDEHNKTTTVTFTM
uniref:ORF039 n=1 Tax=Spodoptera frugiperda granulovirus TaxID=307454 RepID=A0A346QVV8_9BBAC|nr:ORF039 [Spodoptera frugiperda granulovirus]